MLLIARTDAESARLLSSTVDVLDHEFIRYVDLRSKNVTRMNEDVSLEAQPFRAKALLKLFKTRRRGALREQKWTKSRCNG